MVRNEYGVEIKYLKKARMYKLLKSYYGDSMPKMIDCVYKFYRGSEWLCFHVGPEFDSVTVFRNCGSSFFSVSVESNYDEDRDVYNSFFRFFLKIVGSSLILCC